MMSAHRESRWRRTHPLVIVAILTTHAALALVWENPLLLLGQLLFLLGWLAVEHRLRQMVPYVRFGVWFAVFLLVINPLFSSNGVIFWWKGPIVPVLGRLDITAEEAAYAAISVIRTAVLVVTVAMYQWFVDHDRFLFAFARWSPRFVMTAVIAIRLFPFLAREWGRIREVAQARGLLAKHGDWRSRARSYLFVLRPLLFSAMEGSWLTAETLYARGFGSGPRRFYNPPVLTAAERAALGLIVAGLLVAAFGRGLGFADIAYYPRIVWPDPLGDALFLCLLALVWALPLIWLAGRSSS